MLTSGLYGHVLKKYLDHATFENVLVINFDLLTQNNSPEPGRLKNFLGLEDDLPLTLQGSNKSVVGKKKPFLARFYKKYLSSFWKRYRLPSLRSFVPFIEEFSSKVDESEVVKLSEEQVAYLKAYYKEDEKLFREITGWSYWDLVK